MDPASEELERRSRYLSALVRRTKLADPPQPEPEAEAVETKAKADVEPELKAPPRPNVGGEGKGGKEEEAKAEEKERTAVAVAVKARGEVKAAEGRKVAVCVRAADMPLPLQRRAVRVAVEAVAAMPRLESKRLALALKKDFDTTYGPAWHCIVGTSFGSYVTHSEVSCTSPLTRSTFFSSELPSSHLLSRNETWESVHSNKCRCSANCNFEQNR